MTKGKKNPRAMEGGCDLVVCYPSRKIGLH